MKRTTTSSLMALVLAVAASTAIAQAGAPQSPSVSTLMSTPADDLSIQMLGRVFGEAPLGLWAGVGPTSPLGAMFATLCAGLLTVALFWYGYNVVAAVAQTAEDGSFMGRRFSTVWMPIRFMIGFGMLVPAFPVAGGGYWCGAQYVMMWLAKMGIGLANVAAAAGAGALLNYNTSTVTMTADHRQVAEAVYVSNLCMEGLNAGLADARQAGLTVWDTRTRIVVERIDERSRVGLHYPRNSYRSADACGRIEISYPSLGSGLRGFVSAGPFDAFGAGARADVIRAETERLRAAQRSALAAMDARANAHARQVIAAVKAGSDDARITNQQLDAMAAEYSKAVSDAAASAARTVSEPITGAVQSELQSKGWLILGAWYQTLSQTTTEVQKVVNGVPALQAPKRPEHAGSFSTLYRDALSIHQLNQREQDEQVADSNEILRKVFGANNPATTVSVARAMATVGGNSNPMVAMKDLGDYLTGIGGAALTAATVLQMAAHNDSAVVWVANKTVGLQGSVRGAWEVLGPIITLLILALFFAGATLSIYLPMVPFFVWIGGVIGWMTVLAEALVAAPLAAMAHLEAEGEGLGNRTQHGYLFAVNVLLRPVLMVAGFFIASALAMCIGWLINILFAPAVANAQFNTQTGILQFVGFVIAYLVLVYVSVTACFQLITLVPDQVLGWLGGAANVRLGTDTEDRVRNLFFAARAEGRNLWQPGGRGGRRGGRAQRQNRMSRAGGGGEQASS